MIDIGHEETERILREIEEMVSGEYLLAEREVQDKLDDYLSRFAVKDELKRRALDNGLITRAEYNEWRTGQIMVGKRWAELRDSLAEDFSNANSISKSIAFGYMPDVYALNHNYATFQVEHDALVDTSYSLYSREAVEGLFKGGKFYPSPGRRLTNRINVGLDIAWNKRQITSVMLQSILQGESIPMIARRLARTVGESNHKSTIRNVRTMATAVQNAGRVDSYKRCQKMGIKLKQEWMATLDNRTRHEHRLLDGQKVEVGTPFKVDGYEIEYPGDPNAPGYLIYNCRCTLIGALDGFSHDASDLSLRNTNKLGDMTYDEWKASKDIVSEPITKQEEIEERMRRVYGAEYKQYSRL